MRRQTRELGLALAICLVLAALMFYGVIGRQQAVARAREGVLRDNLHSVRKVIDQYASEKGALPTSLEELVSAGYLRAIPEDPFTGSSNWIVVMGTDPQTGRTGVVDLRSASSAWSKDGTPYNRW